MNKLEVSSKKHNIFTGRPHSACGDKVFTIRRVAANHQQVLRVETVGHKACNKDDTGMVRVEIDAAILLQLLQGRRLCAADMRCLDCESKHCLLRLLLKACAKEMA
jgi:hypothetical protein